MPTNLTTALDFIRCRLVVASKLGALQQSMVPMGPHRSKAVRAKEGSTQPGTASPTDRPRAHVRATIASTCYGVATESKVTSQPLAPLHPASNGPPSSPPSSPSTSNRKCHRPPWTCPLGKPLSCRPPPSPPAPRPPPARPRCKQLLNRQYLIPRNAWQGLWRAQSSCSGHHGSGPRTWRVRGVWLRFMGNKAIEPEHTAWSEADQYKGRALNTA